MYFINLDKKLLKKEGEPKKEPKVRQKKLPIVEKEAVNRYVVVPNSGTAVHNLEARSKTMAEYHRIDERINAMLSERRNRTFKVLSATNGLLDTIIVKSGITISEHLKDSSKIEILPELLSIYQTDDAEIDTFVRVGDHVLPKDLMGYTRVDVNSAIVVSLIFMKLKESTYIIAILDNGDSAFVERLTVVPHRITQVCR